MLAVTQHFEICFGSRLYHCHLIAQLVAVLHFFTGNADNYVLGFQAGIFRGRVVDDIIYQYAIGAFKPK